MTGFSVGSIPTMPMPESSGIVRKIMPIEFWVRAIEYLRRQAILFEFEECHEKDYQYCLQQLLVSLGLTEQRS